MKSFKDYLTPARERLLQLVDIKGKQMERNPETELKGSALRTRAAAVLGAGIRRDDFNKEMAARARKRYRSL